MAQKNKFKLTTTSVRQRCRPQRPGDTNGGGKPAIEHWCWDTGARGFFPEVSRTCSAFFV